MSVRFQPLEVNGIKEALRTLNDLDKTYRRKLTVEYKTIVYPMVHEAEYLIPVRPPMSGWHRNWTPRGRRDAWGGSVLPWDGTGHRYIKPFLSGKKPRRVVGYGRDYIKNATVMGVRWKYPPATLFDFTHDYHTKQGAQMLKVLNERYGQPSRALWRAYEKSGPDIQDEIKQLVFRIMAKVNQELETRYGY